MSKEAWLLLWQVHKSPKAKMLFAFSIEHPSFKTTVAFVKLLRFSGKLQTIEEHLPFAVLGGTDSIMDIKEVRWQVQANEDVSGKGRYLSIFELLYLANETLCPE